MAYLSLFVQSCFCFCSILYLPLYHFLENQECPGWGHDPGHPRRQCFQGLHLQKARQWLRWLATKEKQGCDLSDFYAQFRVSNEASNSESEDPHTNLPLVGTVKIRRKLAKISHARFIFGDRFLLWFCVLLAKGTQVTSVESTPCEFNHVPLSFASLGNIENRRTHTHSHISIYNSENQPGWCTSLLKQVYLWVCLLIMF